MARLAGHILAASLVAVSAGTTLAGDYADRTILGFSPDGRTFAFEEFGEQDGSGFAYANIYVIDTEHDAWVSGTPIRVMHENEDETLANVREEARQRAMPWMTRYGVEPGGRIVVSNPSSELSADPYTVRFLTDLYANWRDHAWTLTSRRFRCPNRSAARASARSKDSASCSPTPPESARDDPRRHRHPRLARLPAGLRHRRRCDATFQRVAIR